MSGNPPDNSAGGGTPPGPLQPASPPTYASPLPWQLVRCPVCHTLLAAGSRFCTQCGNAIPPQPPMWPTVSVPPPASSRKTVLIVVGVVLIVLIVLGVGGYMLYQQNQARILQDAKNSEANAAKYAPYNLQTTCFSNRTDDTHLSYSVTNGFKTYYGYATVYETLGFFNPTRFPIDATWTVTLDYPSARWVLTDVEGFHLASNGTAYPVFAFTVTAYTLNNTPTNANFSIYHATIDGTYRVMGTYATYDASTHDTYDSTTGGNTGNGPGSQNNLPKC